MRPARIRVGNQTSSHAQARAPYEFALARGFDAFEWLSDKGPWGWSEDDTPHVERAEMRSAAQEHGMLFSVHAPIAADPTHVDGADAIRHSIRFGGEVGAGVVNMHYFSERGARRFAEALRPLLEAAQTAGVRLSLENTPRTSPDDFNALFGELAVLPESAGQVGMCLDMGHANLFPGTRHDYLAFVDRLDGDIPIIHLHAHENWGDSDSHLPLFTGPSLHDDRGVRGLVQRLKQRGFEGSVVLEQWPDPPEILVKSRQRLREFFDTDEPLALCGDA